MGSLKDVVIQRETVNTAGGDFTVGPLTAADILGIFFAHRKGVEAVFDSYRDGISQDDVFVALVVTFPEVAAEIIARGAGEPDDEAISKARSLDIGAQLSALEKIGKLTMASSGGLGNLAILVERLAGNLTQEVAPVAEPMLRRGSNPSGDNAPSFLPKGTPKRGSTRSG